MHQYTKHDKGDRPYRVLLSGNNIIMAQFEPIFRDLAMQGLY